MSDLKSGQGREKGLNATNSKVTFPTKEVSFSVIVDHLKASADIAGQISSLNIGGHIEVKALDLQVRLKDVMAIVIAAADNQKALLKKISWLKERLAASQSWEEERASYELTRFDPGVFAYRRKPTDIPLNQQSSAEFDHLLCSNCFDSRRKSILQSTPKIERRYQVHMCPECKNEYAFHYEKNDIHF